jgi:hypothetical protein
MSTKEFRRVVEPFVAVQSFTLPVSCNHDANSGQSLRGQVASASKEHEREAANTCRQLHVCSFIF